MLTLPRLDRHRHRAVAGPRPASFGVRYQGEAGSALWKSSVQVDDESSSRDSARLACLTRELRSTSRVSKKPCIGASPQWLERRLVDCALPWSLSRPAMNSTPGGTGPPPSLAHRKARHSSAAQIQIASQVRCIAHPDPARPPPSEAPTRADRLVLPGGRFRFLACTGMDRHGRRRPGSTGLHGRCAAPRAHLPREMPPKPCPRPPGC